MRVAVKKRLPRRNEARHTTVGQIGYDGVNHDLRGVGLANRAHCTSFRRFRLGGEQPIGPRGQAFLGA